MQYIRRCRGTVILEDEPSEVDLQSRVCKSDARLNCHSVQEKESGIASRGWPLA